MIIRLGKRPPRRKRYPVKTTVNLLYRDKPGISAPQWLLAAAVFVVIVSVFAKFAVYDRLAASGRALQQAENLEAQVETIRESNSDYEDVLQEYQHYYFSAADRETDDAQAYVNCQDVLALLDAEFLNKAGMQMVSLSGDVLTVNLTKINLEEASGIARSLSANPLVKSVSVSAANKQQQAQGATVYLTIVLETETPEDVSPVDDAPVEDETALPEEVA